MAEFGVGKHDVEHGGPGERPRLDLLADEDLVEPVDELLANLTHPRQRGPVAQRV